MMPITTTDSISFSFPDRTRFMEKTVKEMTPKYNKIKSGRVKATNHELSIQRSFPRTDEGCRESPLDAKQGLRSGMIRIGKVCYEWKEGPRVGYGSKGGIT